MDLQNQKFEAKDQIKEQNIKIQEKMSELKDLEEKEIEL